MKISEILNDLKIILREHGDIECLIEVTEDDVVCTVPVDECLVEVRDGYGQSVKFIQ